MNLDNLFKHYSIHTNYSRTVLYIQYSLYLGKQRYRCFYGHFAAFSSLGSSWESIVNTVNPSWVLLASSVMEQATNVSEPPFQATGGENLILKTWDFWWSIPLTYSDICMQLSLNKESWCERYLKIMAQTLWATMATHDVCATLSHIYKIRFYKKGNKGYNKKWNIHTESSMMEDGSK